MYVTMEWIKRIQPLVMYFIHMLNSLESMYTIVLLLWTNGIFKYIKIVFEEVSGLAMTIVDISWS